MIQFLSDCDPTPWKDVVGFIPSDVMRESRASNSADLLLTSEARAAVIEVKLGHLMSTKQQKNYELLPDRPDLYLAALKHDEARLDSSSGRWTFLSLSELVRRWNAAGDELARLLSIRVADVLESWDRIVSDVFDRTSAEHPVRLSAIDQKFLARVLTRRVAHDLRQRERWATAGVTSGGGLPLVQAWTPIRGESKDRTFMAEVRWWEAKPGGELRFGVDFDPRPDQEEDEEVRRAAYGLARSMSDDISFEGLQKYLTAREIGLDKLIHREKPSRPQPKGNWERVLRAGFDGAPLEDNTRNTRRLTSPDFYGDGALRFQAIAEINFDQATGHDLTDLIDTTLTYLQEREPGD